MTGQALKEFRWRHGLTQEELAARLGVHVVTVARWETGTRVPVTEHMLDLALTTIKDNPVTDRPPS